MSDLDSVDPVQFSRLAKALSGEIAVKELPRLAELLARQTGVIHYALTGRVRKDGKPTILLHVETVAVVTCHRCMDDMEVPLASSRELVFVGRGQLPAIEDEEEEADYLPADERIEPLALVEEELMLALPMVPRHEKCELAEHGTDTSGNGFH